MNAVIHHINTQHFTSLPHDLEISEPRSISGICVFFLFPRHEPTSTFNLMPNHTSLRVEEAERCQVNRLKVSNYDTTPVLLRSVDLFSGGMQDRVIDTPYLILPGETAEVEALCIEQSRWSPRADHRQGFLYAGRLDTRSYLRRESAQFDERQGQLWREINERRLEISAENLSSSLIETRLYERQHAGRRLDVEVPYGAVGYLIARASRQGRPKVQLFEYYQSPAACAIAWRQLRSTESDELCAGTQRFKLSRTEIRRYLKKVSQAGLAERTLESTNRGERYQLTQTIGHGQTLFSEGRCLYLSVIHPQIRS